MFKKFVRGMSVVVVISSMLLNTRASQACCFTDWCCCNWFKAKEAAPVCPAPAPACAVCPQQISYVPTTSYRTEYTCTPCTSCQPVSTCDPCGGAQTVMQPVTSYVRRPVLVPYTSYRPVVTQLNYAAPACTSCGASTPYYSGAAAVSYSQPAVAAGQAYAAPAYAAPNYAAAPAYATGPAYTAQPSYSVQASAPGMGSPGMSAPALGTPTPAPPPSGGMPNTFQPSGTAQPSAAPPVNSSLMPTTPIPDTDKFNSGSAPRLLDPQDRTTSTSPMNPPMITQAIFNTADSSTVFHQATYQPNAQQTANGGWTTGTDSGASMDGWQASNGQ
ncbi:MAG TPA: hypothetical protein VMJ32_12620 [Pirellulales bacterium]|nr:hypothetical protein [Pirellulales bacterium]